MNGVIDQVNIHSIWNIPKDNLIFVAAGRLTIQKGFDLLIDAVYQLKGKTKPFSVLISGSGKEWSNLEQQIDRKGLKGIVKLIGFQNNLSQIINAADFVLMPSRHEGMPNVAMESMALGKPVFASNVNGIPELIKHRDSGYILDSLSVNKICDAIQFAINHHGSEEINRWGITAKNKIATHFTITEMLDQLESYFYSHINYLHR